MSTFFYIPPTTIKKLKKPFSLNKTILYHIHQTGEKGENGFMNNIQQLIPDFQLKITSDCITSKSGLILFIQLAKQIGLVDFLNQVLIEG